MRENRPSGSMSGVHRQTKEAATDMLDLKSPRHTSTQPFASLRRAARLRRMSAMPSMATELCVTLQLTADDHLPGSINAVHLKDRLGDVETDCRDRLHSWLLRIVGALTAPHIHGTHVPVEEPSTASQADYAPQQTSLATFYSITSSALASMAGGTVMPSALTVLRLMTSSYLAGFCNPGKSAGFSPFRMRST